MNEVIVKKEAIEVPAVTRQMCDDFLFTAGTKLNEQQKLMFYNLALQFNLNPFKREIHAIPYGQGWNFVTGYQVYVARAEATGLLNGWSTESIHSVGKYNEESDLTGARITIYRKDWDKPFVWEVALAEFDKGTSTWKNMKEFMIKKIAIGQGFRLAFPNELGGMPYLKEELEDLTLDNQKTPIREPKAKSQKIQAKGEPISEAQRKRFYAISKTTGATDEQIKDWLFREYEIEHTKDITRDIYEEVCQKVKEGLGDMREPGQEG